MHRQNNYIIFQCNLPVHQCTSDICQKVFYSSQIEFLEHVVQIRLRGSSSSKNLVPLHWVSFQHSYFDVTNGQTDRLAVAPGLNWELLQRSCWLK